MLTPEGYSEAHAPCRLTDPPQWLTVVTEAHSSAVLDQGTRVVTST